MTVSHTQIQKLFLAIISLLKLNKFKANSLLTLLYKQAIFHPKSRIQNLSIEEYFKDKKVNLKYQIFNSISPHSNQSRVSCTGTEELIQLMSIVQFKNPNKVLEIGTNKGGTTYNFYLNTKKDCEIFTVDLQSNTPSCSEIAEAFASKKINAIICNSNNLPQYIKDLSFDLIFIDAGHEYHEIKNDTDIALSLLSKNGIIIWHDFTKIEPGVVKYLNELSYQKKLKHFYNGTLVIYEKE